MADENDSAQEKTEQPSEKRLREAREQGKAPRSKELATAAIFGTGIMAFWFLGSGMGRGAAEWMRTALDLAPVLQRGSSALPAHALELLAKLHWVVLPVILLCLAACIVAPALMGALRFSAKALTPDFTRLSPVKGLARIYGREAIAEFLRALLRIFLISGLAVVALWFSLPRLLALIQQPLPGAVADGANLVLWALATMCIGLILLAAVDVPYQMWSYRKNLMMTREELRQELKDTEGNPEVKGRIRRLLQQLSQGRMLEAVPAADAVVVNPSHYAVALRYDAARMGAPQVVAKGVDEIALAIRKVAEANNVPIVSAPPLARALYRRVRIGGEVPVALYAVVAEVLGYVYQLKNPARRGPPPRLPELRMPDGEG